MAMTKTELKAEAKRALAAVREAQKTLGPAMEALEAENSTDPKAWERVLDKVEIFWDAACETMDKTCRVARMAKQPDMQVPVDGTRVKVYEDRLTRQKLEGMATVTSRFTNEPDQDDMWPVMVIFDGPEEGEVRRDVHKDDLLYDLPGSPSCGSTTATTNATDEAPAVSVQGA